MAFVLISLMYCFLMLSHTLLIKERLLTVFTIKSLSLFLFQMNFSMSLQIYFGVESLLAYSALVRSLSGVYSLMSYEIWNLNFSLFLLKRTILSIPQLYNCKVFVLYVFSSAFSECFSMRTLSCNSRFMSK